MGTYNMIDYAQLHISEGYRVFPTRADKTPLTDHGFLDATTDSEQVTKWWGKWPAAGIGAPTDGKIVLDFDVRNGGLESKVALESRYGALPETRRHKTGGGGEHWIYLNPDGKNYRGTKAWGGYSGIDVQANGNYIVLPPSVHTSGSRYELLNRVPYAPCPDFILKGLKIGDESTIVTDKITDVTKVIPEGERNSTLARLAGSMRRVGLTQEAILAALLAQNELCQPPLSPREVQTIAESISRYKPEGDVGKKLGVRDESMAGRILQMKPVLRDREFDIRDLWSEFNITTGADKLNLRVSLFHFLETGVLEHSGTKYGKYRFKGEFPTAMEWDSADISKTIDFEFCFPIHEYVKIYPKSIIIVAGSKQQGKTSFMIDTMVRNRKKFYSQYFNSETGVEQMKLRLQPFSLKKPYGFDIYPQFNHFADVIQPDGVSYVDYIAVEEASYKVATEIESIFQKLTTGVAILAIQKPAAHTIYVKGVKKVIDRDLGYGGDFSAFRSILYLSMSNHRMKMVYVKTPKDPRVQADGITWSYDIDENGYFKNIKRIYETENTEEDENNPDGEP